MREQPAPGDNPVGRARLGWMFYRALLSTAADNQPDAAGMRRFYELRLQNTRGALSGWGYGPTIARAGDLHWNGMAWVGCPLGTRSTNSSPDAQGITRYDYCDKADTGVSRNAQIDITGRSLASVVDEIRTLPGGDGEVPFANFGPANPAALGAAVFPAGSRLYYQSATSLSSAYTYDVQTVINTTSAAVAAGGDARVDPSVPCAAILPTTPQSEYLEPARTLETLTARFRGTPCTFGQQTTDAGTSLPVHENWGFSSLGIGNIPNGLAIPPGTGNYYITTSSIRVAFTGESAVTFYECYLRASDNSSRNCTTIGAGTYSIVTLGDARVLRISLPPPKASTLTYERVFVERGGNVYFGYLIKQRTTDSARLNLPAANALLSQLGIPILAPQ